MILSALHPAPVATTLTIAVARLEQSTRQCLVSPLPQVDFPTIAVAASLPGAGDMASSALERQLAPSQVSR